LRGGSSASSSLCSSVALEAALDDVGSVFATRVRLRSWYGIANGLSRFESEWWFGEKAEMAGETRGKAHIYNGWVGTARHPLEAASTPSLITLP
jgi:hypothetical protein